MHSLFKSLCLEVLNDTVGSPRFTALLLETGLVLDTWEWAIANRILEKAEEIKSSLGDSYKIIH